MIKVAYLSANCILCHAPNPTAPARNTAIIGRTRPFLRVASLLPDMLIVAHINWFVIGRRVGRFSRSSGALFQTADPSWRASSQARFLMRLREDRPARLAGGEMACAPRRHAQAAFVDGFWRRADEADDRRVMRSGQRGAGGVSSRRAARSRKRAWHLSCPFRSIPRDIPDRNRYGRAASCHWIQRARAIQSTVWAV